MALYLWEGKLLVDDGKLAIDENCCCGDASGAECPCCSGEFTGFIMQLEGVNSMEPCNCDGTNITRCVPNGGELFPCIGGMSVSGVISDCEDPLPEDLVIFDWVIHDNQDGTCELVAEVSVAGGGQPGRIRFVIPFDEGIPCASIMGNSASEDAPEFNGPDCDLTAATLWVLGTC